MNNLGKKKTNRWLKERMLNGVLFSGVLAKSLETNCVGGYIISNRIMEIQFIFILAGDLL